MHKFQIDILGTYGHFLVGVFECNIDLCAFAGIKLHLVESCRIGFGEGCSVRTQRVGICYIECERHVATVVSGRHGERAEGELLVATGVFALGAENAGFEGAVILNKVKELGDEMGFDAVSEEYVNMMDAGIIDPVKVTKSALLNAVSVASTLLTTEAAVADIKEAAPAMPAQPDMDY